MTDTRLPWHVYPTFLGALAVAMACLIWSFAWIDQPFPGFFVDADGRVEGQSFLKGTAVVAALSNADRVTACDGTPMPDGPSVYRYVSSKPLGARIQYRVVRDLGRASPQRITIDLPSRRFRFDEWLAFVPIYWLDGLINILLGAFVLHKRRSDQAALSHWYFCLALGTFLAAIPDTLMGHHLILPHWARISRTAGNALIGTTGLTLAMWVPRPWPVQAKFPTFAQWQNTMGCLFASLLMLVMGMTGRVEWEVLSFAIATIGALSPAAASIWTRWSRGSSNQQIRSANLILWGFALAFLPAPVLNGLQYVRIGPFPHQEWAEFGLLFAPASIAYAILRHQLFDIPFIVRRATLYTLLTASLGAIYCGATAAGTALLGQWAPRARSDQRSALIGGLGGGVPLPADAQRPQAAHRPAFLGRKGRCLAGLGRFGTDPAR